MRTACGAKETLCAKQGASDFSKSNRRHIRASCAQGGLLTVHTASYASALQCGRHIRRRSEALLALVWNLWTAELSEEASRTSARGLSRMLARLFLFSVRPPSTPARSLSTTAPSLSCAAMLSTLVLLSCAVTQHYSSHVSSQHAFLHCLALNLCLAISSC